MVIISRKKNLNKLLWLKYCRKKQVLWILVSIIAVLSLRLLLLIHTNYCSNVWSLLLATDQSSLLATNTDISTNNNKKLLSLSSSSLLSTRVFLNYTSSLWEKWWTENIQRIESEPLLGEGEAFCNVAVRDQSDKIRRMLNATCTSDAINSLNNIINNTISKWCKIDDAFQSMYFDRSTGKVTDKSPAGIQFGDPKAVRIVDQDEDIFPYFTFLNTQTLQVYREYIEPLVGAMRHPLQCCEYAYTYGASFRHSSIPRCKGYFLLKTARGHFLPPSSLDIYKNNNNRKYYFDAGASDWTKGAGGPSLSYFHTIWKRYGIEFDRIYAYEGRVGVDQFYRTIPNQYQGLVQYQQVFVRSKNVDDKENPYGPFLPEQIRMTARKQDYVLFKLDIDSPGVEDSIVDHLLSDNNDDLEYIDEFFYEFHSRTMHEWHQAFLKMRKSGVRAHSWI